MENDALSKLIPVSVLLILGIFEAIGGLYLDDKRSKNDFTSPTEFLDQFLYV